MNEDKTTPDSGEPKRPAREVSAGNPTPYRNDATDKPTPTKLSSLRREKTVDEKAQEERRWKAIQAGLHPDTGKYLLPGDEKTLNWKEQLAAPMQRDTNMTRYGTPYPTAMDRVKRDFQQQQLQRVNLHSALSPVTVELDRLRRMTGPLADNPLLHDQLQRFHPQQNLMDAAMGGSAARAIREHASVFEQQRRYLDPLLDRDFVRRLTGELDDDLMRRATALHEPDALQMIRDQVTSAATLRITGHWGILDQARQSAERISPSNAFASAPTALAGEAQRMLSVYGPTLAEQTRFLTEYHANLGLFHTAGLTVVSYERADLLARIAMPATLAAGFDGYDPLSVERIQAYGESVMRELEADFGRDGNPVHAWEALTVARRYGIDPPVWVDDFLTDAADRILEIREEVAGGRPVKREAERVGKALGFGNDGPGQGGWFKHATMLERDRTIYFEVNDKLRTGIKLDFAYDEVAKASSMSRSTIVRAFLRITKLSDEAGDQSEGEDEVS